MDFSIDVYDGDHNYEDEVPLVTRKTMIGGFFSFIFFIAAFNMILISIITLQIDNIEELKTLIPLVVLHEIVPVLTGNVDLNIKLGNYGGDCIDKAQASGNSCDSSIFYLLTEVQFSKTSFSCKSIGLDCYIDLTLEDCEVDSTTDITIKLQEKFAYTSSITVNLIADSSIPDQKSTASVIAYPANNTVFRGKDPTHFRFSLTPTYYTSEVEKEYTGYHVSALSLPYGGTSYSTNDLGFTTDLIIKISLERNINGLRIERRYIFTIYLTLLTLLGSIPGVQSLIGLIMTKYEGYYLDRVEKNNRKAKFDDISGKRNDMKKFLNREDDKLSKLDSPLENKTVDSGRPYILVRDN